MQTPLSSAAAGDSHAGVLSFKGLWVQRSGAPMLLSQSTTKKMQGTPVEGPSL